MRVTAVAGPVLQRLLSIGAVTLGLLFASPVAATLLPVGTSPADDLIFNFDFPPVLPPGGPYTPVQIVAVFTGLEASYSLLGDIFNDLNGTGGININVGPIGCTIGCLNPLTLTITYNAGTSLDVRDGIFSVGFRLASGAADLDSIAATVTNAAGASITLNGAPRSVPEPQGAVLSLTALLLLAWQRRRAK